jgi:hypothetical protein
VSLFASASSFACHPHHKQRLQHDLFSVSNCEQVDNQKSVSTSRAGFLRQSLAATAAVTTATFLFQEPALARGRATLEFAYDKYTPRILAGGSFYKSQLKSMIAGNDFTGIKSALAEPPKKR